MLIQRIIPHITYIHSLFNHARRTLDEQFEAVYHLVENNPITRTRPSAQRFGAGAMGQTRVGEFQGLAQPSSPYADPDIMVCPPIPPEPDADAARAALERAVMAASAAGNKDKQ